MIKVNKVKKIIALSLAMAVLVGVTRHIGVERSNAHGTKKQDGIYTEDELNPIGDFYGVIDEDGVSYDAYMYKSGSKNYTQFIDKSNDIRKDVVYDSDNMILEVNEYEVEEEYKGEDLYKLISSEKIDIAAKVEEIETRNEEINRGSYSRKIRDGYEGDIWYMSGTDNGKNMLKIGRKASYEIAYHKLNEDRKNACDEFISKVGETKSLRKKLAALVGVSAPVIIAIYITGGWAAIIAAGLDFLGVYDLCVDMESAYDEAANKYNRIKEYGKKL